MPPRSPVSDDVAAELILHYCCEVEHWFAKRIYSYARYFNGETELYITNELVWGDDDPEWIINKVVLFVPQDAVTQAVAGST
ncbi:hypothetical protein [Citrobacter sp. S-77]|uniref:hypothetical protein n=1 Tax=Citrobacter sp. S-77 TaxID=1080067 RepID=UPI000694DD0E|nr:hypothetical protein [Citrobacter sp. S-77]